MEMGREALLKEMPGAMSPHPCFLDLFFLTHLLSTPKIPVGDWLREARRKAKLGAMGKATELMFEVAIEADSWSSHCLQGLLKNSA